MADDRVRERMWELSMQGHNGTIAEETVVVGVAFSGIQSVAAIAIAIPDRRKISSRPRGSLGDVRVLLLLLL